MPSVSTEDLTDEGAVEDVIGAYTSGASQDEDDRVARWIKEGSDLLKSMTGREFYWVTGYTERTSAVGASNIYVRDHVPIDAITSIEYDHDPSSSATTVDSDNYEAVGQGQGTIRHDSLWTSTEEHRAGPVGGHQPGTAEDVIKVTYDGGWKTPEQDTQGVGARDLPYDVEMAVLSHVELKWHRNGQSPGVESLSMADGSISYRGMQTTDRMQMIAHEYRLDRL